MNGDSRCSSFLASNVYLPCFLLVFIRQFVYSSNVYLAQLVGYLWTCFFVEWRHARMLMEEIRFTSYSWYGTYLIVLQVFIHPKVVHDAVFGKQHPAGIFPAGFSIPSTPISESPPGQVRRHISELLTKAKADFREHFGTQLGCGLLGPCSHLPKSMGNPWFGWFGSIDLGGECDTEVNCRCSESETQKNYIMYPISFVSRSFKNQLIDVPMSEVNHVSDYIG